MKVYLVSEGWGSDYIISAVFSTEEAAQAFIHSHPECNGTVVSYEVDKPFERKKSIFCFKFKHYSLECTSAYVIPDINPLSRHIGHVKYDRLGNKFILLVDADSLTSATEKATGMVIQTQYGISVGLFPDIFKNEDGDIWYDITTGKKYSNNKNGR